MTRSLAPVVLFAYARPDHLHHTLTALAAAKGAGDTTLWVFSDGPKNAAAVDKVAAVRAVLAEPNWRDRFLEIHVIEAEQNKGLASSIVDGVSLVMAQYGSVIVLEDDVIVSSDFLDFMNDALDYYKSRSEVGSITAYCPLEKIPGNYDLDVMLVPRSCSQCWATWQDRWELVDWTGANAHRVWSDRRLRKRFSAAGSDRIGRLRDKMEGKSRTWSILFNLWHTLEGRATIYPVQNRVTNIGYDGTGENTRAQESIRTSMDVEILPYQLAYPIAEDKEIVRAFFRVYSGPWYLRAYRTIRNWPMPRALEMQKNNR